VKLFRTWLKDRPRHYAAFLADDDSLAGFDHQVFAGSMTRRWQIEQ
jgi:hypothetical protein